MAKSYEPYVMNVRELKAVATDNFVRKENAVARERHLSKIARLKALRLAKAAGENTGSQETDGGSKDA